MNNEERPAGTEDENELQSIASTSRQTIGNTLVGCSTMSHYTLSPEIIDKLKVLLYHTPTELLLPIHEYWGVSKEMCDKATQLINQYSQQKLQSGN